MVSAKDVILEVLRKLTVKGGVGKVFEYAGEGVKSLSVPERGGLDVALAMGGGAYNINTPKVVKVELTGKLNKMVSAKDVILEVLRKLTVKGGVGKVFEYAGEGVKSLSVPERA